MRIHPYVLLMIFPGIQLTGGSGYQRIKVEEAYAAVSATTADYLSSASVTPS